MPVAGASGPGGRSEERGHRGFHDELGLVDEDDHHGLSVRDHHHDRAVSGLATSVSERDVGTEPFQPLQSEPCPSAPGSMASSEPASTTFPATNRHVQAASDGASLAIEPEPNENDTDDMKEIKPSRPKSSGLNGLACWSIGSAHGLGVKLPGPCWTILEAPTGSSTSLRGASEKLMPVTCSAATASSTSRCRDQ